MKRLKSFLGKHIFLVTLSGLCFCSLLLFTEVDKEEYKNHYSMDKIYSNVEGDIQSGSLYWLSGYKDAELNLSFKVDSLQNYDTLTKYRIGGVDVYTTYYKTNRYTLYIFPVEDEAENTVKGTKEYYDIVTRDTIGYKPTSFGKDIQLGENLVSEMEYGILEHTTVDDESGSTVILNNYSAYSLRVRDRMYNLIFISDDISVDEVIFTNTIVASMRYTS